MAGEDLRSALEEAYNESQEEDNDSSPDSGTPVKETPEPERDTALTEESEPVKDEKPDKPAPSEEEDKPVKPVKKGKKDAQPAPRADGEVKAPESWKPQARDAWTNVPAEARQEILRREREIVQTLQQTAGARKLAQDFVSTVSPFEMMIRAEGADPLTATRELFGQAAILRIGTPAQKAQLVASVVKRFNVPIQDLDAALVGEQIPDEEGKLAQMLERHLAPVKQFMSTIDQTRQQREQKLDGEVDNEIETFANDKANEFFYDVKDDMADIMEMSARRGQTLTLKQAYDRALKTNDSIQETLNKRKQEQVRQARAAGGTLPSRGATPDTPTKGDDLRSDLLSAFDSIANR